MNLPSTYLWDIENPKGYANAMGRYKTRRELAFLLAHVSEARQRVMDAGGGSGRFAMPLAERGHDVTVVDISQDALRLLHRRKHPRVSTRCADFLRQTFDNQFDVVIAIESIPSFTSVTLEDLFAKIHSVLRPGVCSVQRGRPQRLSNRATKGRLRTPLNGRPHVDAFCRHF